MPHFGRDYASFQGDLSPADCEGIDFAFVKITQGADYKNPDAVQQVSALRAQHVQVGYYHFLDPAISVGDQLHNFNVTAQAMGNTNLPLAVDVEWTDPAGWQALAGKVTQFVQAVEGWTYPVPNPRSILYVNINFYNNLPGFPWGRWVWLADPNAGAPHKPCLVLQGAPRPVSSADLKVIDPDVFQGSDADWNAFTRSVPVTPPPPVYIPPIPPLPDPAQPWYAEVPGYGITGTPPLVIVGFMEANGWYVGHNVGGGSPVFAGVGNPTTWTQGFDPRSLPAGTPLATLWATRNNIVLQPTSEQL